METRRKFLFEGRRYFVELSAAHALSFYYETDDPFTWGETEVHYEVTNGTKAPLSLMRILTRIAKELIYGNRLSHLSLSASDERRARIYRRFLGRLKGYTWFEINRVFYVRRAAADLAA